MLIISIDILLMYTDVLLLSLQRDPGSLFHGLANTQFKSTSYKMCCYPFS